MLIQMISFIALYYQTIYLNHLLGTHLVVQQQQHA